MSALEISDKLAAFVIPGSDSVQQLRKAHREQRCIELYQQSRMLPKPKTTYMAIIPESLLLLLAVGALVLALSQTALWYLRLLIWSGFFIVVDLLGRWICITSVKCYQHYAQDRVRRRCLCVPSCSEYAIAVFKRNVLIWALHKVYVRLFKTCRGGEYRIDLPCKGYPIPTLESVQSPKQRSLRQEPPQS